MTRQEQKDDEKSDAERFLEMWNEPGWRVVDDGDAKKQEEPDVLFHRDGEIVGVEFVSGAEQRLVQAGIFERKIVTELEAELRRRRLPNAIVRLAFLEASALSVQNRKFRARVVAAIGATIEDHFSTAGSSHIGGVGLNRADIDCVHDIYLAPADELLVMSTSRSYGRGITVVQPHIDQKNAKLVTYRTNAMKAAVLRGAVFGGVWLVVTLFDQPGGGSSVLLHRVERLDRRGFDRAFVLDRWSDTVAEIGTTA